MNFEHLIQINDPLNPFVESMTREQVWEGLVLRVEQPQLFVIGLDRCVILSRGHVGWSGEASEAGPEVLDRYLGEAVSVAS